MPLSSRSPETHSSESGTRPRILDAAETEFSRAGFGGASMKPIAEGAGVAQGLLHYHYGSKEGLYEAVIERRALLINAGRLGLLDAVDTAAPDALHRIFDAFFRPPFGPEGGGRRFAPIFARLAVGTERDRALVARCYDACAHRFVAALQLAEPRASRRVAATAYSFALGALIGSVARDGRIERLSAGMPGGRPDGDVGSAGPDRDGASAGADEIAIDSTVARLVAFATGGLRALVDGDGDGDGGAGPERTNGTKRTKGKPARTSTHGSRT